MEIPQLVQVVAVIISSAGLLLFGAGYGYAQFKQGGKKLTQDDIKLFNEQLDALRKIISEQKEQMREQKSEHSSEMRTMSDDIKKHTQEIGRLQGINEEKEKKIKELTDLLANRDPALSKFIEFSMQSTKYFQELVPLLVEDVKQIKKIVERRVE